MINKQADCSINAGHKILNDLTTLSNSGIGYAVHYYKGALNSGQHFDIFDVEQKAHLSCKLEEQYKKYIICHNTYRNKQTNR